MGDGAKFLKSLFECAVSAASPAACVDAHLPGPPPGRTVLAGAGKAAAAMAQVADQGWSGPLSGLVVVPYGHAVPCERIEIIEAAHPVPDDAGVAAAAGILRRVSDLARDDTVVCLLSGGGSALLCLPIDGVTLAEKQSVTRQLLRSGAAIHELNCVRKKLSAIKGGKLAAACAPAAVITLLISDVPGNDASMVASGPTIADTSSASEALEILGRYNVSISTDARRAIENGLPVQLDDADVRILASSDDALLATAALALENQVTPYSLGDLAGDARQLAHEHADLALQIAAGDGPVDPPCVILSGGETTVEVRGNGRGGRNGEYALSLAIALNGHAAISALACDTDGIDGTGDNAGCFVTPDTLSRAAHNDVDPRAALQNNDSYRFFASLGDLISTGPTLTNVNDFRAILIAAQ